jgi:hypothetical protein
MVWPIAPRLQTITASYCSEYCRKLYHSGTVILYCGTTVVICGPLFTEASLCGAWLHVITAQKTMKYQYNSFILQGAIHNTVTIQNNQTHNDTQYKFTAHSKTRCHHTTFNTQSGSVRSICRVPTIHSPVRSGPVHLPCPPQYRRLSLLLTGEQPVRTSKGFSRVIYYTWAAAGGCEMFLRTVICSTCAKYAMKAPGIVEVLQGQGSKTGTKW